LAEPRWDGLPLEGRTILVRAEQGYGDALQFVRYASILKRDGARVIVECGRPVARLLATCDGVEQVIVTGQPRPPFDCHVSLLSLPGILGTTVETIPATTSYLRPDEEMVSKWRAELSEPPAFKIGIAWQGNKTYSTDELRSFPLAHFERVARIPGVRLYSLQVRAGREQLDCVAGEWPIVDLGERLGDFHDTAAIVRNLDLVISSDTAPVHLAGAIGAPVWIALPRVADWRWLRGRDDTPWYPSATLFRQTKPGDWDGVFRRIEARLANII
jgi:hypothetical protein